MRRVGELREQAQRARRLAQSFPVNGDKELLDRHARELDAQADKIESEARAGGSRS